MSEKSYDLVVCGGGVAGIAAAAAASRRGLKTAIIEKTVLPGGLATSGIIYIYLPLCDGNGNQVTFGIAEEMLKQSIAYGPDNLPENWRKARNVAGAGRYRTLFSPASFILGLDEMLEKSGVDCWYDTVVTGAEMSGDRITAVNVFNKSGFIKLNGKCFVDATGDADLLNAAGAELFCDGNSPSMWCVEYAENCGGDIAGHCRVQRLGKAVDDRSLPPGINGKMVSDMIIAGRREYREKLPEIYAAGNYDRRNCFPLKFPAMADLRHTRCIKGRFVLRDGMRDETFADSVGLAADWRRAGEVWKIPYRALLPEKMRSVLAAGRCISSVGDAWEVTRVIPVAAMTGEVAGVAAALAVASGVSPEELPYDSLAEELRRSGFKLKR